MKWSEITWQQIEPDYNAILQMPFITELSEGTLPKEKFQFYIAQDSLYLEHFGRTLSLIAARASDIQDVLSFMRFAENAILVENALHESYFKEFGVSEKGILEPACHHYIHFLKSTSALDAVEIAMAAVLPCFWIYKKVGDHILNQQKKPDNAYQNWIDTYGGEEFSLAVQRAVEITDRAAKNTTGDIRKRMTEAFVTASKMEYLFWKAAYELKKWD
ncbi:thiaminase II [Chryseobacterium sp. CT-SW4]|uniref:thiaminase II n=1 Tax=Chryseobacterium sp. SW-1 TaxID=3157343 RepID=UPI003B018DCE